MNRILLIVSTATYILDKASIARAFSSFHNQNKRIPSFQRHRHHFCCLSSRSSNSDKGSLASISRMSSSAGSQERDKSSREEEKNNSNSQNTKAYTVTVCVVPPPENVEVWQALSDIRKELKDPGYFRWPPHVNLLYPFIKLPTNSNDAGADGLYECNENWTLSDVVEKLASATKHTSPFCIQLNKFGTFGGKKRGVLWLHPDSTSSLPRDENEIAEQTSPLVQLQTSLEEAFPMCKDQSQKGGGFTPHMTVSHFPSLADALNAQRTMEESYSFLDSDENFSDTGDCLQFLLDRIYLLERKGDEGQFLRVAEIAFGGDFDGSTIENEIETKLFDPPQPFPDMPDTEDDWVYEERMLMKSRRKNNRKSRRGKGTQQPSG